MDLVKKNIVSIICGVVILLAIIAKFYPLDGKFDDLKADANKRVQVAVSLTKQLDDKTRVWPSVDPSAVVQPHLTVFPSPAVTAVGAELKNHAEEQANSMFSEATRLNQLGHKWIYPAALPNPQGSAPVTFQSNLNDAWAVLKGDTGLDGTVPPTQDDVKQRGDEIWARDYVPLKVTDHDKWVNQTELEQRFAAEKAGLMDRMRAERAAQHKIYLDADAIQLSAAALDRAHPMDAEQIWYSQLAFWIQQDVVNTIYALDRSPGIEKTPIKRLMRLEVAWGPSIYQLRNPQVNVAQQQSIPISNTPKPSDNIPVAYTSPTGRTCNSLYDVAQFTIIAHVDANQIQAFLNQLSLRRFITVRNVDVSPVDYNQLQRDGFLYGGSPVVQLTLDCEELFLRQWTVSSMPPPVRKLLSIGDKWEPWSPPPLLSIK